MPVNPDLVMATGAQVVEIPVSFSETTTQSAGTVIPVSYTHLTLPTIYSV